MSSPKPKASGPDIPRSQRKRRKIEISMSAPAHDRLEEFAEVAFDGNASRTVEALILQAKRPPKKIDLD